jgi:hypothetical protein
MTAIIVRFGETRISRALLADVGYRMYVVAIQSLPRCNALDVMFHLTDVRLWLAIQISFPYSVNIKLPVPVC